MRSSAALRRAFCGRRLELPRELRAISSRFDSMMRSPRPRDRARRAPRRAPAGGPSGSARIEERPVPAPARALAQRCRHRVQVDHRAVLPSGARDSPGRMTTPAAGREHDVGAASISSASTASSRSRKLASPSISKIVGIVTPSLLLELGVGVDEESCARRRAELAAERRLACARQSDQIEIAPMQMHRAL